MCKLYGELLSLPVNFIFYSAFNQIAAPLERFPTIVIQTTVSDLNAQNSIKFVTDRFIESFESITKS